MTARGITGPWRAGALLLVIVSVSGGGARALRAQAFESRLERLLPSLDVTVLDSHERPGDPYRITLFSYESRIGDWPYGIGFVVRDPASDSLLWSHLVHGDYPPHTFGWARFDDDERPDLFFLVGFEDVSETYVFVNRVRGAMYSPAAFALRFRDEEVYASVVDLDQDGRPELLLPQARGIDDGGPFCDPYAGSRALRDEWRAEFTRLAGPFVELTFRNYRDVGLWPLDSVRIARTRGRRWVTPEYPEHVHWRIEKLEAGLSSAPEECVEVFEGVIDYLREQVGPGG